MAGEFRIDDKRKIKALNDWVNAKQEYKSKAKLVTILRIIALIILITCVIGPGILLWREDTILEGILCGLAVGLIFAAIPFFTSQSIKIKLQKEFGFPFCNMENEILKLYDDGIELLYHNKTSKYWESMDVYRIPIENINAMLYDSNFHILTIIGEGELLSYDDFSTKRINHQNSQRKFYNNSPYAFMTIFEKEEVVTTIQNMARHKPQK